MLQDLADKGVLNPGEPAKILKRSEAMNEVTPVETCAVSAVDPSCARAPVGMLCELTHRCPLQCPYCSNPTDLERVNTELTTGRMAGRDASGGRTRHSSGASVWRRTGRRARTWKRSSTPPSRPVFTPTSSPPA